MVSSETISSFLLKEIMSYLTKLEVREGHEEPGLFLDGIWYSKSEIGSHKPLNTDDQYILFPNTMRFIKQRMHLLEGHKLQVVDVAENVKFLWPIGGRDVGCGSSTVSREIHEFSIFAGGAKNVGEQIKAKLKEISFLTNSDFGKRFTRFNQDSVTVDVIFTYCWWQNFQLGSSVVRVSNLSKEKNIEITIVCVNETNETLRYSFKGLEEGIDMILLQKLRKQQQREKKFFKNRKGE